MFCACIARCGNTPHVDLFKPPGQNRMFWGFGYYERRLPAGAPDYAGTQKVGCYLPNDWGLYDMHGKILPVRVSYRKKAGRMGA